MVFIQLLGLPGTGRKTLMKQICQKYKADSYYDFTEVDFDKQSDIKVCTMLSNFDTEKLDVETSKIMLVSMSKVFEKKVSKEYIDYFKADPNILYDNNPFKYSDQIVHQLNYCLLSYDYNFDNFSKILDNFIKKKVNIFDEMSSLLKGNNIPIPIVPV